MRYARYMVSHPTRQSHGIHIAVSGSGHTTKHLNELDAYHQYARNFVSKAVFMRTQLILTCDWRNTSRFASRLMQASSAWSVKTRRAPSRHCRDARVYRHTTTAMHDNEYTPPLRNHFLLTAGFLHKGESENIFSKKGRVRVILSTTERVRVFLSTTE